MNRTIWVRFEGPLYPLISALAHHNRWIQRAERKLESHLRYRRNARSWEYMERLARVNEPSFDPRRIYCAEDLDSIDWKDLDRVILLWPDASGLGCSPEEKKVFRRLGQNTSLMVLNGRGRFFVFTRGKWALLRLRRFLDRWFIGDALTLGALLVIAPVLVLTDCIRGKA